MWGEIEAPLVGRLVGVEPLAERHEPALYAAARFREIFRWMNGDPAVDRQTFHRWLLDALASQEVPFCVLDRTTGAPIGSTRYLSIRPEHRGLEIGHTWLTPSAWRTGANVETKLLLLEHAFERLGCIRVEFKTDASKER